jgi:polysaccharide biosynthesis PFTS motif protein
MNLFFGPLDMFVRRILRGRMRRIMRGYRNLKKSGRLGAISTIQRELTTCNLNIDERFFSARFFGAGLDSAELIIRQYLLVRIGGVNLNRALLLAAGKSGGRVLFPMPSQWVKVVEKNGFEVNRLATTLMWAGYVSAAYFYGLFTIGKILVNSGGAQGRKCAAKPYVYFHALAPNNIPRASSDGVSYDIVSWYLQWQGRKPDIDAIHHTVRNASRKRMGDFDLVEQSGPLPMLAGLSELVSYFRWSLTAVTTAAFDALRARWWHALLLNQAALAAQARIVSADFLAQEYLFHNSGWIYRPLWTYEVEHQGSTVSLYFYSTNCEGFKRTNELAPLIYGYAAMNWLRYLVWDEGQANFVRRAVGVDAKVEIVGPIWFSCKDAEVPCMPPRTVAVFDVQPFRDSFYRTFGFDFDYYTPRIANQFLLDIKAALTNIDCCMAHKRKREIGMRSHPHYRLALKRMERSMHYLPIDPDLSAVSLIQECDAVISMPFTSTAFLGREANKPSIYYDPFGLLQKDDPAAHGIMIIQDQKHLMEWVGMALKA